jgi:uncharacterized protein YpiB (UPF0302 family)
MKKEEKLEMTMELLNSAIDSAVKRTAHFESSPKTIEMIEQHTKEDAIRFEEHRVKQEKMQETLDDIKAFMERALVVIEAYEDTVNDGKKILWLAGFITAVGGAWIVLTKIFRV